MTHARRQRYRHLARSAGDAVAAAAILLVALSVPRSRGEPALVFTLLPLAAGLSLAARRSKRIAGRCGAGADSERAVRFVLNQLARGGWTVRNGVAWPGGGDVDHLVRSPDALGLAIETKTLTFSQEQMRRTDTPVGPTARYRSGDPSSGRHTPEYDRDNYLHLLGVIGELKHDGVKIDVRQERFDVVANEVADYEQQVRRQRGRVPPIYFFADPFGFSGIHLETLGRLLAVKRWEALLTFMVGAMRRVLDHPDLETPLTDFLAGHRGASAQALSAAGDPG